MSRSPLIQPSIRDVIEARAPHYFSRRPGARFNRGRIATGGSAGAPAYSPLDEGTGVLWIDPHDPTTYTIDGSNNFTDLKNKVSGVSLTIASDPNLNATAINGQPGITLDTTDWFIGSEAAVLAAGTNAAPRTVITVVSGSVDDFRTYFGWGRSDAASANRFVFLVNVTGNGRWACYGENNGSVTTGLHEDTVDMSTGAAILIWTFDGTNFTFEVNNVARTLTDSTFTPGTLTPNRYTYGVGPWSLLQQAWGASLGDHLVYASVLDAAARTRVYNYLSTKYGGI